MTTVTQEQREREATAATPTSRTSRRGRMHASALRGELYVTRDDLESPQYLIGLTEADGLDLIRAVADALGVVVQVSPPAAHTSCARCGCPVSTRDAVCPGGCRAVLWVNAHACLYCGAHNCPSRASHEDWWRGNDEYARLSLAERKACTACGRSVDNGQPCAGAPVLVGAGSAPVQAVA